MAKKVPILPTMQPEFWRFSGASGVSKPLASSRDEEWAAEVW